VDLAGDWRLRQPAGLVSAVLESLDGP